MGRTTGCRGGGGHLHWLASVLGAWVWFLSLAWLVCCYDGDIRLRDMGSHGVRSPGHTGSVLCCWGFIAVRVLPVGWWICCSACGFLLVPLCCFCFWIWGRLWALRHGDYGSCLDVDMSSLRWLALSLSGFWEVQFRLIWGLEVDWFWISAICNHHSDVMQSFHGRSRWPYETKFERGRLGSVRQPYVLPRGWLCWIVFGLSLRIGEASVPGPGCGVSFGESEKVQFELGVCNPNGIFDKGHFLADSEVDMWAMSETHLSVQSLKVFRKMLRSQAPQFPWLVHGKPVLPRHQVSDVGLYSGVGILSRWPSHPLPHSWNSALYHTGRICAATTFVRGIWISGCVIYGTPCGPTHPQAKKTTESLLLAGFERVLQMSGPRYVCGDFNHDHSKLETVGLLRRAGFVDLQDLQFARHGVYPVATCRGKTRRDFCFISPEFVPLFQSCRVVDYDWSDHSAIVGSFAVVAADLWRFPWPLPDAIPWKELNQHRVDNHIGVSFAAPALVDEKYVELWSHVENDAFHASQVSGKPLSSKCFGRGTRTRPLATRFQVAPLKASRAGDVRPQYLGFSQIHRQWFRQLRRIESYKRMVRNGFSVHVADHRAELWNAIVGAPGFRPSFSVWWQQQPGTVSLLQVVPPSSPEFAVAELLYQGLESEVRNLEAHLRKHQRYVKQLRKLDSIATLYKEVQRDPPAPAEILIHSVSAIELVLTCVPLSLFLSNRGSLVYRLSMLVVPLIL